MALSMEADILTFSTILTSEATGVAGILYICHDQGEAKLLHIPDFRSLELCCNS